MAAGADGGSVGAVSDSVTVVWDDGYLGYDLGGDHPLHPVRLALTVSLARRLGVLDAPTVTMVAPQPAGEDLLTLVHDPAYLEVVRQAPRLGLGGRARLRLARQPGLPGTCTRRPR